MEMSPDRFLAWADRRHFVSVRAIVLYVTLWMTWRAFTWAAEFAYATTGKPGLDIAAIIGAVTVPITALQSFTFRWFMEAKDAISPRVGG